MKKKKIVWITADSFIDVDMGIIPPLQSYYDIHWIVVMGKNTERELPPSIESVEVLRLQYRNRSPKIILLYYNLIKRIKKMEPDIIYLDYMGIPFFPPMAFKLLDKNKIIYLAHNIAPRPAWSRDDHFFIPKILKRLKYVHAISEQYNEFMDKQYSNMKYFNIPMSTKSFGEADNKVELYGKCRLLFFGHVAVNKRLDKLIEAYKGLSIEDKENSELIVYGKCDHTEEYYKMIQNEEHISLYFGFVPDKEIPNIFCSSSFLILPYDDVSQSGPSMIAYNYSLPLICTDLEGFKEIVKDGVTGFLYKTNEVKALRETLHKCINMPEEEYSRMKGALKRYVDENLSVEALVTRYCNMFNYVINANSTIRT